MTTKRQSKRRERLPKITPEAVGAFVALQEADTDEERTAADADLHAALRLPPWHCTMRTFLDVDDDDAPDWAKADEWRRLQALQRQLAAAE